MRVKVRQDAGTVVAGFSLRIPATLTHAQGGGYTLRRSLVSPVETRHDRGVAERTDRLRAIPSVDRVLNTAAAQAALARFQRDYVTESIRAVLDDVRQHLAIDGSRTVPSAEEIMAAATARM